MNRRMAFYRAAKMGRFGFCLCTISAMLLLVFVLLPGPVLAGISSTKHNLSSGGTGTNKFGGTGEICVFCHTPHGSDTTAAVPLWNRVLGSNTYTTYDSLGTSTLDGDTAPVGSVSIACLSCHDGTQAMNVMINQPGSGGYNAAGAALTGTWTGPAATATPAGSLNYATASIVNIGTDLRNDHPIGIQYGGGGLTTAAPAGTLKDSDFTAPQNTTLNGITVWWVDTGGAGRQKTDLALYTRTEATVTGGAQPFVECASCHDPHSSTNPTFLRIANTGSAVCLACHTK